MIMTVQNFKFNFSTVLEIVTDDNQSFPKTSFRKLLSRFSSKLVTDFIKTFIIFSSISFYQFLIHPPFKVGMNLWFLDRAEPVSCVWCCIQSLRDPTQNWQYLHQFLREIWVSHLAAFRELDHSSPPPSHHPSLPPSCIPPDYGVQHLMTHANITKANHQKLLCFSFYFSCK